MRKIITLAIVVAGSFGLLFAKPMEALSRYNVVLVHGAAPESEGFEKECDGDGIYDAYSMTSGHIATPKLIGSQLGGAAGMLGDYENDDEKKLTYWLDSAVFEDYQYKNGNIFMDSINERSSPYIYIQRAFANPAASPAHNAHEIGDRTWKGNDKCSVRRSLFEEAQEVRAEGSTNLEKKRNDGKLSYRSIPSRNILIAHSMGGVASHEYVTDTDVYNGDVDKVITLDSPHEGTGSLNMLIDMRDYGRQFVESSMQYLAMSVATAALMTIGGKEPVTTTICTNLLAVSLGMGAVNRGVTTLVDKGILKDDFAFKSEDSLTKYIFPKAKGITALKNRPAHDEMPMIRLLAGKGGMTFSDPNENFRNTMNFMVPEALSMPIMNVGAQLIDGDGSAKAVYVNSVTGLALGFAGGIALQDIGTTLIPEKSGLAESTDAFNDPSTDTRRYTFDAAINANAITDGGFGGKVFLDMTILANTVGAVIAIDAALSAWPWISAPLKVAMASVGAGMMTLSSIDNGIADIQNSHENAKARRMLDTLYSAEFSYNKVMGGDVSGKTLLMEDFLYEKPFVNLGLFVSADSLRAVDANCFYEEDKADKEQLCEIGLYGANGEMVSKTGRRNYKEFRTSALAFKSSSDWEKMGVKVDRWERVDGLTSGGDLAKNSVPIRHVERYNVPAITVDNWIEKYSFVVDDLMPHRLRQIRMNFNFNEEIAWECDITKDPDAKDACEVFRRSGGGNWETIKWIKDSVDDGKGGKVALYDSLKTVPHPVKKNGQFDFEPGNYGIGNLLAIQKDNQNTVTISTVNKIGLSNTQRFYYLFKATDNKLNEVWPRRDIVLNKITGFKAFASALGYQGFHVANASDSFLRLSGNSLGSVYSKSEMDMDFDAYYDLSRIGTPGVSADGLVYDSTSAYFTSRQSDSIPAEGDYVWQFFANIVNTDDSAVDTNSYEVPFKVDRTAPVFSVTPEYDFMNPSKTAFVARYAWADTLHGPDIRAMRWTLEGGCTVPAGSAASAAVCTNSHEMRAFYDVGSSEFAVPWDSASRAFTKNHGDGLYRVKAFAVDAAVSDSAAYMKMANLVDEIARDPSNVNASLWPTVADSLNATTEYATFVVDVTAPKLENVVAGADSGAYSSYASLARPARNSQYGYATYDSLLKISYKVTEPLIGRDSTAVTVLWNFVHLGDTSKVDRAGDSVWVKSTGSATAEWREASGMRLEDGDYEIRALASDAAKNDTLYRNLAKVRIDKTAPTIFGLTSDRLVYPDSVTFEMESV